MDTGNTSLACVPMIATQQMLPGENLQTPFRCGTQHSRRPAQETISSPAFPSVEQNRPILLCDTLSKPSSGNCNAGTVSSIATWAWVRIDASKAAVIALSTHAKDTSERMFRLLWSGLVCFIASFGASPFTRPKLAKELTGLVCGCTTLPGKGRMPLHKRPIFWTVVSGAIFLLLQWIFW
jgi:hypothetical protein